MHKCTVMAWNRALRRITVYVCQDVILLRCNAFRIHDKWLSSYQWLYTSVHICYIFQINCRDHRGFDDRPKIRYTIRIYHTTCMCVYSRQIDKHAYTHNHMHTYMSRVNTFTYAHPTHNRSTSSTVLMARDWMRLEENWTSFWARLDLPVFPSLSLPIRWWVNIPVRWVTQMHAFKYIFIHISYIYDTHTTIHTTIHACISTIRTHMYMTLHTYHTGFDAR